MTPRAKIIPGTYRKGAFDAPIEHRGVNRRWLTPTLYGVGLALLGLAAYLAWVLR